MPPMQTDPFDPDSRGDRFAPSHHIAAIQDSHRIRATSPHFAARISARVWGIAARLGDKAEFLEESGLSDRVW